MDGRRIGVLVLALLLDRFVGDPPNRYHPVACMGQVISAAERHAPPAPPPSGGYRRRLAQLGYGAMLVVGGSLGSKAVGRLLGWIISALPAPLSWLAEAGLLKLTFSLRGLVGAADQVRRALESGDLPEARRLASWHLVSRDTGALTASQVAAATIESVAENASDGVVAPLVYYALGGLPAALAYRFVSTADSMLGYRDAAHEWLGKAAARLDDLLNLLPARLTASLIVLAAGLAGENSQRALRIWRRDARLTASLNAGHPMSAMAGALGVELEKVGHYQLGGGQPAPTPSDIVRAVRLVYVVTALAGGVLAFVLWIAPRRSSR
jgi:adenosylcobinamide-phosphate synthase